MPHFLDIPTDVANDSSAPYAVLPLPFERTVTFGTGTANGPAAILRASHEVEDFDEELRIPIDLRAQTLPAPRLDALGTPDVLETIRRAAIGVLQKKRFLLSLGGEHTVTNPLVAAAQEIFPGLCVLHIDAHLDLRESYLDTPFSHACVMRRVKDMEIPTVHVGIRSCSAEEYDLTQQESIPVYWAADIVNDPSGAWIDRVLSNLDDTVYVSIDIDAFDPSLVPGTGTPEPGGLQWQQVTALLRKVIQTKTVVAADIVEVSPVPGTQVSEFVAARLGAKLLTYLQYQKLL